jgi:hypothetical protein
LLLLWGRVHLDFLYSYLLSSVGLLAFEAAMSKQPPLRPIERCERNWETVDTDDDAFAHHEHAVAEDAVDRFGLRTALVMLAAGLLIASLWAARRAGFDKCFRLENAAERYACYDAIRADLSKPVIAKGAEASNGINRSQ